MQTTLLEANGKDKKKAGNLRIEISLGYLDKFTVTFTDKPLLRGRILEIDGSIADDGRSKVVLKAKRDGFLLKHTAASAKLDGKGGLDSLVKQLVATVNTEAKTSAVRLAPGSTLAKTPRISPSARLRARRAGPAHRGRGQGARRRRRLVAIGRRSAGRRHRQATRPKTLPRWALCKGRQVRRRPGRFEREPQGGQREHRHAARPSRPARGAGHRVHRPKLNGSRRISA